MNMITKSLLAATALVSLPALAHAAPVITNVSINVPNNIDGVYLNVITGVTGTSGAAVSGWDLNLYNNGAGFTFYGAASPSGVLASGTPGTSAVALDLAAGAVIGSAGQYNQFQTLGTLFQVGGNHVVGFRFLNESTGILNYGYARITTSSTTGFPATITQLVYENTGASLTVAAAATGAVPEPATWAMMLMGFGAVGFSLRRRNNVKTAVRFA